MTTRSTRLVAYFVPLLALGVGVSLAPSGPAVAAAGIHSPATFCLTDSNFSHRRTIHTSPHYSHRPTTLYLLRQR